MGNETQRIRSQPNAERDAQAAENLKWLNGHAPTDAEADAYLRGLGITKKCEVCGQDATLTNEFVARLAAEYRDQSQHVEGLEAGLQKIYNDNEASCGCECDTETCCARVGEPCAKCDARTALKGRQ